MNWTLNAMAIPFREVLSSCIPGIFLKSLFQTFNRGEFCSKRNSTVSNFVNNTFLNKFMIWFGGMFGALQLEGCGFESTSKSPRRDPGQVLHSQLLMRFGVKLRFSVRAVVGSASEWEIW